MSSYGAFVDRVLGYQLETRAFLPPLLNVSLSHSFLGP